jgi:protein gp37
MKITPEMIMAKKPCSPWTEEKIGKFLGGDLFSPNVPFGFIADTYEVIAKCSQHSFLVLTKYIQIAQQFYKERVFKTPANLYLGVTVESYKYISRISTLLKIPAAKRFVSFEPLLGHINNPHLWQWCDDCGDKMPVAVDFVVIGCESLGSRAGRFQDGFVDAAIDIIRKCKDAGVKVHVKQIPINGRVSHNIAEWPKELQIQEQI